MAHTGWPPPVLRALARDRVAARGEMLFRQDDPTEGMHEVVEGRVRLRRFDAAGTEIVLHRGGPGDWIAEASLFSESYHCDAMAESGVRTRHYPKGPVLAALRRDPVIAQAFMARLAREVMALRARLERRRIRSAEERVLSHLALSAGPDGRTVAIEGTLKDLAAELGLSHEALYRTLAKLEAAGRIRRGAATITLRSAASG